MVQNQDSSWTVCGFFFTPMVTSDGGTLIFKPTQDSTKYHRTWMLLWYPVTINRRSFQRVTGPELDEALAARYAMSCASLDGHRGILAADSSKVIYKIILYQADRSQVVIVIHDFKDMASKF